MNINKHPASRAFLNLDDSLHVVDGSLSSRCFGKLALQTKSDPTLLLKHSGLPFSEAKPQTEEFPPEPSRGRQQWSQVHSHRALDQSLGFAQDSF